MLRATGRTGKERRECERRPQRRLEVEVMEVRVMGKIEGDDPGGNMNRKYERGDECMRRRYVVENGEEEGIRELGSRIESRTAGKRKALTRPKRRGEKVGTWTGLGFGACMAA